jgi:hypothetical protein
MFLRTAVAAILVSVLLGGMLYGYAKHRRWAQYEYEMQSPVDDPHDAWEETEFAFARLRFRSDRDRGFYAAWGIDANRSERHFITGLRRLTRVNGRSVEEIVDVSSDEIYNWPWVYAVAAGDWILTDSEAARLRQYFERGGSLMVDDFHGELEWADFMYGISQMFSDPTRVVELDNSDPIFHVVYDLTGRIRVPGYQIVRGQMYERGGYDEHWRALVDDKNRVQIGIFFNQDLGDAWEYADAPEYPEKYASQAYRLGINYLIYAMSH